eukprot:4391775-Prymnesium_polylepis.2
MVPIDLMVPIGDIEVGIGSPLVSRREPKRSFLTPRGRERRLRLRRRDVHRRSKSRSDAERHPHALPAHHARSARPPLGIGGARSHRWGAWSIKLANTALRHWPASVCAGVPSNVVLRRKAAPAANRRQLTTA